MTFSQNYDTIDLSIAFHSDEEDDGCKVDSGQKDTVEDCDLWAQALAKVGLDDSPKKNEKDVKKKIILGKQKPTVKKKKITAQHLTVIPSKPSIQASNPNNTTLTNTIPDSTFRSEDLYTGQSAVQTGMIQDLELCDKECRTLPSFTDVQPHCESIDVDNGNTQICLSECSVSDIKKVTTHDQWTVRNSINKFILIVWNVYVSMAIVCLTLDILNSQ
jgi:hypothetical protein